MIGFNEGNGHPYSFSAIFNHYNPQAMQKSGWTNIYNYLQKESKNNFGISDAVVTHIYTQDPYESQKIAQASNIPNICHSAEEMIPHIDAVIIARDDWKSHYLLSKPFLEQKKFVLIDKPLSLSEDECTFFESYIKNGQLISFSSLRFAAELDALKTNLSTFGEIKLIRGITPKSWERYGIHLLDGILGVIDFTASNILKNQANHESYSISTKEGFVIEIDCMGDMLYPMLQLDFFSSSNHYSANCLDAFTSFKRLLTYFVECIKGKTDIQINLTTLKQMQLLRQGIKL